jgi:hypothetical protein
MPAVVLVPTTLATSDIGKTLALTALTVETNADTLTIGNYADRKVFLVVVNADATHAATVSFAAGDGVLSARGAVTQVVAAASTCFIPLERIETARVLNLQGTNAGKIIVNTTIATGGVIGSVSIGIAEIG